MLSKAGFTGSDAVENAAKFISRSDQETDTFVTVFREAFLEDYLDLDLSAALRLAHQLTTEFKGDPVHARRDFHELVKFCADKRNLDLPKPQCAAFAARVTEKGVDFPKGVSADFLKAFDFVRSKAGPALSTGDALKISEEVVSSGPDAAENFIQGYRYAVSKSGLKLEVAGAVAFAKQMAATRKN